MTKHLPNKMSLLTYSQARCHLVYIPHFVTHVQQDGFLCEKLFNIHSCDDGLRVDVDGRELEVGICERGRVVCEW
jgi:hypothetical protein